MISTSQKKHQTTQQTQQNNTFKSIIKALAIIALVIVSAYFALKTQERSVPAQFSLGDIPGYHGEMSYTVNEGMPFFTQQEIDDAKARGSFETYGALDALGRCTSAVCNLSTETMPADNEKRKSISDIHPTAWVQARYDCVDSKALMTRTHLVGWLLSAENANKQNLITGTRYMNADAMTVVEILTARYIEHGVSRHVLYRVTPVFEGGNLFASGVLMEGYSLEDSGQGVCFCEYVYNVQPGISIDYSNGRSTYTGIFMDTLASSVVTDGIALEQFVLENGVIHKKGCGKLGDGYPFYGDTAMKSKWNNFGYTLCDCAA